MTAENQRIRDALTAAECIIVNALHHQPDDDNLCKTHLLKACEEVKTTITIGE